MIYLLDGVSEIISLVGWGRVRRDWDVIALVDDSLFMREQLLFLGKLSYL